MGKSGKVFPAISDTLIESNELAFFESIFDLIQQARRSLEQNVNTTMTITYYEIGKRIIEKEQQGEKRAKYGQRILQSPSDFLTVNLGKGATEKSP